MSDNNEGEESNSIAPIINHALEKHLVKSSIEFKIGNKMLEIEDCEIGRSIAEKFRGPDGIIQISQDEVNELGSQLVHANFRIVKTYREKTSGENASREDRAEALEEMLTKQEELGARMLTMKNLNAAILQVMQQSTTEDLSLSDSAVEVASGKLNLSLEEYIYERDSYELDDLSKDFNLTEFTKPMSELHEDPVYQEIEKSLPNSDEIHDEKALQQFQTLVWMNYRFIRKDVLLFYAAHLEFPNIKDDLQRCPPYTLDDDRTPPQFLRQYREMIARYLEREIWKISRFASIVGACSENEYFVEIIKRYLRACIKKKMKPTFARIEQLFLEETWTKYDHELLEREFFVSRLESEDWDADAAVEFVNRWHSQLSDLTSLSSIKNPTKSIFEKLPGKFKGWFRLHYEGDYNSNFKDHVVLCSSLRKFSKYSLKYLKSPDLESFD